MKKEKTNKQNETGSANEQFKIEKKETAQAIKHYHTLKERFSFMANEDKKLSLSLMRKKQDVEVIRYTPRTYTPETDTLSAFRWFIISEVERVLSGERMGWSLSFFRNGFEVISAQRGYGRAPWEANDPNVLINSATRMHLASVSKPITAIGFFALMEDWNRAITVISQITHLALPAQWGVVYSRLVHRAVQKWATEMFGGSIEDGIGLQPIGANDPNWVLSYNPELSGLSLSLIMNASTRGFQINPDKTLGELLGNRITHFAPNIAAITVRKLMRHQSGIDYRDVPAITTAQQLWANVEIYMSRPLRTDIGYENGNFQMVRVIIEHLSGELYQNYMQRRVLVPADCGNISCRNDDPHPALYYGYVQMNRESGFNGPAAGAFWGDSNYDAGAYGWFSSAHDLAKLFDAVRREVVLKAASRDQMFNEELGVYHEDIGGQSYGHNGLWVSGGVVSTVGYFFPPQWTASLICNSDGRWVDGILKDAFLAAKPIIKKRDGGSIIPYVKILNPVKFGQLRYTLNGTDPSNNASIYTEPMLIHQACEIRACLFDNDIQLTAVSKISLAYDNIQRTADLALGSIVNTGILWKKYEGEHDELANFNTNTPSSTGSIALPSVAQWANTDKFRIDFEGLIKVDLAGTYRFNLTSDDGSKLWIGNDMVVDNDYLHGPQSVIGEINLAAGYHTFRIWFFEKSGGETLIVKWTVPGANEVEIPQSVFAHV